MKIIEVGTRVRALHTITEDGSEPDAAAKPCDPGFVHAREGDEGEVVGIRKGLVIGEPEEATLDVVFDRTGIVMTVIAMEVEAVE